ncbi:uncharacterized protein LOC131878351 [Tigriopus californicus]|uniref:uncharacterized protein LOC131878351 n=1 Tax=Tigriopus californicus TaxID=6832 RepID=UPI0027D9DB2D|nr:uncharacterized protein LOC131878351 [Tigriopus californicus]
MDMCFDSCQQILECDHVIYNSDARTCLGKSRKSGDFSTNNSNTYTISKMCVPGCSIDGTDFLSDDIDVQRDIISLMECQYHCQEHPDCIGSVWALPWNVDEAHACRLKRAMPSSKRVRNEATIVIPKYCLGQLRLEGDFYQFQNNRFKFIVDNKTFEEAYYHCEDLEGNLVSLETPEKYAFIRSAIFQLNFFNSTTFSGNYQIGA